MWISDKESKDFPGGPVVKNPPVNAGDTGSIPDPGSPCHRATKPQLLSPHTLKPVLGNKRSRRDEKPRLCNESSPHSSQLKKAHSQPCRPSTAEDF